MCTVCASPACAPFFGVNVCGQIVALASAVAVCCGRGCACAGAVAAVAVCVLSECITIIRLSMRAESCAALTSHFCASVVVVPCAAVSVHAVRYKPAAAIRAAIKRALFVIVDGRGIAPLTWSISSRPMSLLCNVLAFPRSPRALGCRGRGAGRGRVAGSCASPYVFRFTVCGFLKRPLLISSRWLRVCCRCGGVLSAGVAAAVVGVGSSGCGCCCRLRVWLSLLLSSRARLAVRLPAPSCEGW